MSIAYIPVFSKIPSLSVFPGLKTHKQTTHTSIAPGVDRWTTYIGKRPLPALSCSLHLFVLQRREGGQCLFVLHPLSNIVIPFPLRRCLRLYLFFFQKKFVRPVFCFSVRCLTTYALIFLRLVASRFAHCFRKETSRALVLSLWISYRIVLYYNTYLFSSKRLTSLFIQTVTVRYMYSGNQDVAKYRAYGTVY